MSMGAFVVSGGLDEFLIVELQILGSVEVGIREPARTAVGLDSMFRMEGTGQWADVEVGGSAGAVSPRACRRG